MMTVTTSSEMKTTKMKVTESIAIFRSDLAPGEKLLALYRLHVYPTIFDYSTNCLNAQLELGLRSVIEGDAPLWVVNSIARNHDESVRDDLWRAIMEINVDYCDLSSEECKDLSYCLDRARAILDGYGLMERHE